VLRAGGIVLLLLAWNGTCALVVVGRVRLSGANRCFHPESNHRSCERHVRLWPISDWQD